MSDAQHEFVKSFGAPRGPQGARGEQGKRGERGERGKEGEPSTRLPVSQARAVVYLFVLNLLLFGACFWGLVHYAQAGNADRCTTLQQIEAIPVPQPVAGNPSREWESKYEQITRARGRELGCTP